MPDPKVPQDPLVLSYLGLRKAIGIIGLALPFVLALGKVIFDGSGIEGSMSAYYYTVMRDVFVGSLCAIGVFLLAYRGYGIVDSVAGKIAAVAAVGTSWFPTSPGYSATPHQVMIGNWHAFFAATLFLTMAFFSLFLFRKTNKKNPTAMKRIRNAIYLICGMGIIACVGLAFILNTLPSDSPVFTYSPLFWLEAAAIIFFGISWFVKGEAILKDEVN